jgi:hypothetical protein
VAKTTGEVLPDPKDEARYRLYKNFTSKAHNWAQKYRCGIEKPRQTHLAVDLVLYGSKIHIFNFFLCFTPKKFEGGGGGEIARLHSKWTHP